MKKLILTLVFLTSAAFAGTGTSIVTNVPVCVAALVPSYAVSGLPAWAPTNSYVLGDVVRIGGVPALCVGSGVSSNIQPAVAQTDTMDLTVTWRSVSSERRTLCISNTGGATVYLAPTAAAGQGLAIPAGSSVVLSNGDASLLRAYLSTSGAASTNNIVEW